MLKTVVQGTSEIGNIKRWKWFGTLSRTRWGRIMWAFGACVIWWHRSNDLLAGGWRLKVVHVRSSILGKKSNTTSGNTEGGGLRLDFQGFSSDLKRTLFMFLFSHTSDIINRGSQTCRFMLLDEILQTHDPPKTLATYPSSQHGNGYPVSLLTRVN